MGARAGGGRAALSGDGGIELVELHHHHLTEEPRLFFVHYWSVGDAVRLARAVREAVDATNVVPMAGS
ncbi:DUF1259 domain-containing protein [Streptomyces sp. CSDS2]|uniref:DUF1259 domain-containing protein n=1 Tax=Streptomyces sp. CSDS2 TaxID=3055051 RepID=UPI0025AF0184|nr:DUF1259 domain-containing protein [Streptomyces sp. CSDS2]MDN3261547.1 DUF1259 domain-containing protein [Streptomyces sp. CSDS2]